ncbi:MAG: glutamine-hydrolyzing GMP synthase [Thermoplasmata archaeon]|jgi:GMP synthase (glutamine-hydrolysing)
MKSPSEFCAAAIERIRAEAPGRVIVAASGGIDSTAAAILAQQALGDRSTALFVNTGLLRKGEVERVESIFRAAGLRHEVLPRSELFLSALADVTDPEEKRRRIGTTFIRVFETEAKRFGTDRLVQGTIAPDWIESGGALRDTIKTHHNVGGIPKDSRLRLIEPLRDLYKDEVRELARFLKIPEPDRQPFPGPGLAVRVGGALTPERVERARVANAVVEEEVERAVGAGTMPLPWQYFAVLLPIRTVGVTGDNRVYGDAVSVRIVESIDAMTAVAMDVPRTVLKRISERITRELPGQVVRVLYDVTDKPPATIEWE